MQPLFLKIFPDTLRHFSANGTREETMGQVLIIGTGSRTSGEKVSRGVVPRAKVLLSQVSRTRATKRLKDR